MKLTKKLYTFGVTSLLVISLLGCATQTNEETPTEKTPVVEAPTEQSEETTNPQTEGNNETSAPAEGEAPQDQGNKEKPAATKEIELIVEGQPEVRKGTLAHGNLGYYLYTLPNFELVSEEPNKDLLFFTNDPEFFVRIEALDSATDLAQVKENATEELKLVGNVVEMKGQEIGEEFFRTAEFFLHASNAQLSKNIVVLSIEGSLYKFTMNMPNKEAAEGVTPSYFAMLKTMKTHKK